MRLKIFLITLTLFIIFITFVSATKTGDITSITYDVSSRPYYIAENPLISTNAENTGTETYDSYLKVFVTSPDGTIYEYDSNIFSFKSGFSFVATTNFDKLGIEGIGVYNIQSELWRNIDWWPDEKLDTDYNNFEVIFNKPSGYDNYLFDDSWHHPSDSYIRYYSLLATNGATSISSATQRLNDWVYNYITYTQNNECDGDNSPCGYRSQDYDILYDRKGDCNDFADLYISLARSINIPSRSISIAWVNNTEGANWVDYGSRLIIGGHAISESSINSNWIHVDPTGDNYNDPLQYLQGRYTSDITSDHIIGRAWTKAYDFNDDSFNNGEISLQNGWIDVSQDRPYDNTWTPAGLSISAWASSYSIKYGDNVTIYTKASHLGDMTARNTRALMNYTSGLGLISGANPRSIGNITWNSADQTISWIFNAQSIGQKNITIYVSSDDTSTLTLSFSFSVLDRDDDNDGVNNSIDNCPTQKGPLCNHGCPDTFTPIISLFSPYSTRYSYQSIPVSLNVYDNLVVATTSINKKSKEELINSNQKESQFFTTSSSSNTGCLDKVWMNNGTSNISLNSSYFKYYIFNIGINNLTFYANDTSGNLAIINIPFIINTSRKEILCNNENTLHNCSSLNSVNSIDGLAFNSTIYRGNSISLNINWTGYHWGDKNFWAFFLGNSSIPIKTCTSIEEDYNINNTYIMNCLIDIPSNFSLGNTSLTLTSNDYPGYCEPNEQGVDAKISRNVYIDCFNTWVLNDSWSQCDKTNHQYKNYFDTNNCNKGFVPPPENQTCDYCTPNWIEISTSCKEDDSTLKWFNDSNDCFKKTGLDSDLENKSENITYTFYCDYNKDGFIGNLSNINTTLKLDINKENGTINFKEGNNAIINFEFNLTNAPINLASLFIEKQSNESNFAYLIIKGLDLSSKNQTKTVFIDKISTSANRICIKDLEITSISEISSGCDGENEVSLICPGASGSYTCDIINNSYYQILGLLHSGIREYTYTEPIPSSGGGGGSGGGGVSILQKSKNISGTNQTTSNPLGMPSAATNETSKKSSNETSSGAGITGAIIGAGSLKRLMFPTIIFIVIVVCLWIGFYVWRKKRTSQF